jgi:two-component system, cell cycle sensor histidine kinase and response regulator CckA
MRPDSFFDDLERAPTRIAGMYAFVGGVWILVSDLLAAFALDKPAAHLWADLAKGWLFIAATAGLVFLLARRAVERELAVRRDMTATQERFQSAATQFPFTFAICDAERRVVFLNARGAQLVGQSAGEALGRRFEEVFPLPLGNACRPALDRALETRRPQSEVVEAELGGTAAQLAVTFTPILDAGGAVRELHVVLNDLTALVQVERRVRRLNRSLQSISAANSVLVHAASEPELLQAFCNALVGPTGHRLVWVGLVTPGEPNVRVAARAGLAAGYLDGIQIRCDDTPQGRGPSGLAIRTGQPQVCHDFTADERMAPWRERAARHGMRSSIAVPLRSTAGILGALTMYSSEPHRFDEEEVKLLMELAEDLALGLDALRGKAALAETQRALVRQEELLRNVLADQGDLISRFRPDGTLTFVNEAFARFFGGSVSGLVGTSWRPRAVIEDLPLIEGKLAALSPASPVITIENRVLNAAGEVRWVQFENRALYAPDGTLRETQSVGRDVTERKAMEDQMAELVTRADRFSRALDQLSTHIYMKDTAGRYFYANRLTLELFGVSAAQLRGKGDTDFFPPATVARLREVDARVLRGESTAEEIEVAAADGSRRVYWEIKTPLFKEGTGEIQGLCGISTDITDRKESERELRASRERLAHEQARLRALLDSIPDLIFFKDTHSVYLGCNRAFEAYSGLAERELIGKTDLDLVTGELAEFYRQKDREMLAVGRPQRNEEWIPFKNGGGGQFETLKTPYHSHTGELLGLIGISRDITQRRQAEAQVRDALAYLGALIEASPLGIISYDETGQAQTANEAAARLVGATVGQLLGQNFRQIRSWRDSGLLAAAERALERGQSERIEAHFTTTFGKEIWMAAQFVPFQRGEARHLLLLLADISERERATGQLRLQSAALQAAANAIVITNAAGVIEWVNDAFTRSTGYTREEVIGRNPRVLKSGRHSREFYEGLWQTILAGEVWHGEMHNLRKDGSPLEEEATITPVKDATGKITHFIAIKQDITERKSLEKQLLRAQRMEGIGLLAGGIAHDLNNVLAPILMGADLLKLTARDEQAAHQLDGIVQSARRGADIVKQVLTFARGIEGERIPIQPKHVIKEMVRMARETFPRNLQFSVDIPSDLWPIVGDPTQLHQVLLNLSVNARDAMPDGGMLTYGARNAEVDALLAAGNPGAKPGPHVVLRVQDSGTGIAPEVMERIFEPFFTTKELGKGTGLGLSTVIGIVRSHGGFVTVESQVGKGTAFEVWLPANPQAGPAVQVIEAEPLPLGHGELVLVVDDEADILRVTRAMLEGHGYRVLTAGDGTQALTELSQHPGEVRLVITDILMPFMDGVQLLHALRRMAPELKVVASSGALGMPGQKDRTDEVKALGVRHILHKPYSVEQLLRAVQAELHGDAARP